MSTIRARETSRCERAGADAEIDDRPRGRIDQPGRDVEHFFVVRDERANPRVVLREIDPEVRRDAH